MTVHVDRSLRLPQGEYFAERERKTGIAIHHTVCGAARTTIELWLGDRTPHGARRCNPARVRCLFPTRRGAHEGA